MPDPDIADPSGLEDRQINTEPVGRAGGQQNADQPPGAAVQDKTGGTCGTGAAQTVAALVAERDWFASERDTAITEQFRLIQERDAALTESQRLAEERDNLARDRDRLAAALRAAQEGCDQLLREGYGVTGERNRVCEPLAAAIARRPLAEGLHAKITAQPAAVRQGLFQHSPPRGRSEDLRERVASLPRLRHYAVETVPCKICGNPAAIFDVIDFNKTCAHDLYPFGFSGIPVVFYRCGTCRFIFTFAFDEWTRDDFLGYIYNEDYHLVDPEYSGARATRTAAECAELLRGCETARILDYGSGTGVFAAEMTAQGFKRVECYDPISAPERPVGEFDIVTCFEALEHSLFPLAAFADMHGFLAPDGAIIVGQSLQPANIAELRGNWHYIAPRNGHMSIFAEETFHLIADWLGLILHLRDGWYGFSQPTISCALQGALARLGPIAIQLTAPAENGDSWNKVELWNSITPIRWTCSSEIVWPPRRLYSGAIRIRIPFVMEIVPEFASNSRVSLGDAPLPTQATSNTIIALAVLPTDTFETIKLITSDPPSAQERRDMHDSRYLGLAIPVAG
jgi:2-polyprenyl-6-hydroxyphenyl methylase/3-demethylubiquinone-9 3-methyltransferase